MLWLTAIIWGFAFVAQKSGMLHLGPFIFNGIRFLLGGLALLVLLWFIKDKLGLTMQLFREAIPQGAWLGVILFAGASFQQAGIVHTEAGKAGFITGLYVILVPLIGLFLGQRPGKLIWAGAFIALAGLYLLTVSGKFQIEYGDLLVMISAVFWAMHVQLVNSMVQKHSPLLLSIIQFLVCGILSILTGAIIETTTLHSIANAWLPLLYGGLISVAIAYTLQVFAQQNVQPSSASLILSFETVFAVIGGALLLGETLLIKQVVGCLLMLGGILMVQMQEK